MLPLVPQIIVSLLLATLIGFMMGWVYKRMGCLETQQELEEKIENLLRQRRRLQDELLELKATLKEAKLTSS